MKRKYTLDEILFKAMFTLVLISTIVGVLNGVLTGDWDWPWLEKSILILVALTVGRDYGRESADE